MSLEKYHKIITPQYRDKPKFMAHLDSGLSKIDCLNDTIDKALYEFDIDRASGNQLDIIGEIVHRERGLDFQPINGNSSEMDDDLYRLVLKCKVLMNNWDGKIPSIYKKWNNTIPDIEFHLKDNQDMSMSVTLRGYITQIKQELIQRGYIVPKPGGVRINYTTVCDLDFKINQAMVITSSSSSFINMNYEPVININFKNKLGNVVTSNTVSSIDMKGVD